MRVSAHSARARHANEPPEPMHTNFSMWFLLTLELQIFFILRRFPFPEAMDNLIILFTSKLSWNDWKHKHFHIQFLARTSSSVRPTSKLVSNAAATSVLVGERSFNKHGEQRKLRKNSDKVLLQIFADSKLVWFTWSQICVLVRLKKNALAHLLAFLDLFDQSVKFKKKSTKGQQNSLWTGTYPWPVEMKFSVGL